MEEKIISLKKTARVTGLLYFIFAITSAYGYVYVQSKIMVSGDIDATTKNMLANEFLFRTGVASNIITHILFVLVVLFLYRLLKQVNELQAKLMVGLVIVGIPVTFLIETMKIIALGIFKGDLLNSFEPQQIQDLATVFIKIGSYSGQLIAIYWGLWLIPLGLLVYQSGFIPRILGVLLLINGAGYIINGFTFILFPDYLTSVSKITMVTLFIGEIPLILWLLIIGVKVQKEMSEIKISV